jgi:hypothetical protein
MSLELAIKRTLVTIIFTFILKTPKIRKPFCSKQQYSGGGLIWYTPMSRIRESLYDWRFTANQFILAQNPLRLTTRDFFATQPLRSWSLNTVALVRKRTIPTERPSLVGEVSANFSG